MKFKCTGLYPDTVCEESVERENKLGVSFLKDCPSCGYITTWSAKYT